MKTLVLVLALTSVSAQASGPSNRALAACVLGIAAIGGTVLWMGSGEKWPTDPGTVLEVPANVIPQVSSEVDPASYGADIIPSFEDNDISADRVTIQFHDNPLESDVIVLKVDAIEVARLTANGNDSLKSQHAASEEYLASIKRRGMIFKVREYGRFTVLPAETSSFAEHVLKAEWPQ